MRYQYTPFPEDPIRRTIRVSVEWRGNNDLYNENICESQAKMTFRISNCRFRIEKTKKSYRMVDGEKDRVSIQYNFFCFFRPQKNGRLVNASRANARLLDDRRWSVDDVLTIDDRL